MSKRINRVIGSSMVPLGNMLFISFTMGLILDGNSEIGRACREQSLLFDLFKAYD